MTAIQEARDNTNASPRELIRRHTDDFAAVLPSHIKPATWVRLAQGALKRGKLDGSGRYELEVAAANNPGQFMATLLDAARQGLEPGTEQYYLTPRKVKGRLEILGIRGYQGEIELIYRAGAVSSVVAEIVREHDDYRYKRGVDDRPIHEFPSFAGEKVRGTLKGVYAYAVMKDGAVSRVIELGQEDIDKAKKTAQGADSEYSPWLTHPESMWLKTAVHQLQKWVPTSAEYMQEQARAVAVAFGNAPAQPGPAWTVDVGARQAVNQDSGEVIDMQPSNVVEEPAVEPPS